MTDVGTALIIGGGIAGPVAAMALQRAGIKATVFEAHDSIWLLAAREYGEPRFWRLIARENDIDNPRRIESGRVLVLPPLDRDEVGENASADRRA